MAASPSSGAGPRNLTGVARKVRDNCADLHNAVQRWNALQLDGSLKLREIVDATRERRHDAAADVQYDYVDPSSSSSTFAPHLQALCSDLLAVVGQLRAIHDKMEMLANQFDSLVALADVHRTFDHLRSPQAAALDSPSSSTSAVFQTLTLQDYARTSRSVANSYALDLKLKMEIAESVGHVAKPTVGLFLLTAWLHQPHVNDQVAVQLEAILVDSGLIQ